MLIFTCVDRQCMWSRAISYPGIQCSRAVRVLVVYAGAQYCMATVREVTHRRWYIVAMEERELGYSHTCVHVCGRAVKQECYLTHLKFHTVPYMVLFRLQADYISILARAYNLGLLFVDTCVCICCREPLNAYSVQL